MYGTPKDSYTAPPSGTVTMRVAWASTYTQVQVSQIAIKLTCAHVLTVLPRALLSADASMRADVARLRVPRGVFRTVMRTRQEAHGGGEGGGRGGGGGGGTAAAAEGQACSGQLEARRGATRNEEGQAEVRK